jgi:hypothetical protein
MGLIPFGFDPQTYLSKIKRNANFSELNSNIYTMLLRDYSIVDILNSGEFFPNIRRNVISKGNQVFSLDVYGSSNNLLITSNILSIGDIVDVTVDGTSLSSIVTSILSTTDFTLSSNITIPVDKTIFLNGIKLFDIERVAHVNFLMLYQSDTPSFKTTIDSNFNLGLYKLLYPDVGIFTSDQAYDDYLSRDGTRIGSVLDFATMSGAGGTSGGGHMGSNISTLTITSNLNLAFDTYTGRVTWAGTDLYYVTTDHTRTLESVSPNIHGIASEYAIKKWTHDLFWPSAHFTNATFSNVTISPYGTLDVEQISCSNLKIKGVTTFESNAFFGENVEFQSNVAVRDNLYGGRIGIGTTTTTERFRTIESNVHAINVNIDETLYVGNRSQFDGTIYGSNIFLKGDLKSASRIGVGPVDFTTYNIDGLLLNGQYNLPYSSTFSIPGSAVVSGDMEINGEFFVKKANISEMNVDNLTLTSNITVTNINVTAEIHAIKNISTIAYISSEDVLIREDTDIVNMLYDTSKKLKIPREHVTTTRTVSSFTNGAKQCKTDNVSRIFCDAPSTADFLLLDNGSIYKIDRIATGEIDVISTTLPSEVNIIKFTIVDQDAIVIGRFLAELTKQINAIAYQLS